MGKKSYNLKDMSSYSKAHTAITAVVSIAGFVLGCCTESLLVANIYFIVASIFSMLTDVRVLSLKQINGTYGQVVHIEESYNGSPIVTIAYRPYLGRDTETKLQSDKINYMLNKKQLTRRKVVFVQYERGHEWVGVGGTKHIIAEIICNFSALAVLGYTLAMLFNLIFG